MRSIPAARFGPDPLALSDDTVDRLLGGLAMGDAPPAYADLAAVLSTAHSDAAATTIGSPVAMASAMATTLSVSNITDLSTRSPSAPRRRPMLTKLIASKIAVIATGGVLAAGGVAAASTGALPTPVQDVVANAAGAVGVSLPASTADVSTPSTDTASTGGTHGDKAKTSSSGGSAGATVTCAAATNHGQYVSSVAHSGGDVSAAAKSDCGKKPHSADAADKAETSEVDKADGPEVDEPEAPEVDKQDGPDTNSQEQSGHQDESGSHDQAGADGSHDAKTKAAKTHESKHGHGHGGGHSGGSDSSGSGD